jgi:hypothetical protein
VTLADKLPRINSFDDFPRVADYVQLIKGYQDAWIVRDGARLDTMQTLLDRQRGTRLNVWAIEKMIALHREQLRILRALDADLAAIRSSERFRIEAGMGVSATPPPVTAPHPIPAGPHAWSLIRDAELLRRCRGLLADGEPFDRVILTAGVVLEDRIRTMIAADATVVGTALMERAFGEHGPLQLSDVRAEQTGAMRLYSGTIGFFRNATGHRVSDIYSAADAWRFLMWIDLLLEIAGRATPDRGTSDA